MDCRGGGTPGPNVPYASVDRRLRRRS